MENNIQVPEYIKPEMNKIFGQSVVGDITSNDSETAFPEENISGEELETARNMLKSNDTGSVKATIKTDAINGIKGTTVDDDKDFDEIINLLNEQDIRGKTITNSGKAMIKDLLKSDPTEDELKHISEEFSDWLEDDNPHDMQVDYLENLLGERITNKIKEITTDEDYSSVLKRFTLQLFSTYQKVVQYNDDMRHLSMLAKKVNEYNKTDDANYNEDDFEKFNKEFKNLTEVQNDISEFMNKIKNLDDRNKRLKQDYTIDDYDVRTVESVKKCLDTALSFELVYEKVRCMHKKFKKDFKDSKLINSSIENWINDIRNDPNTLFTFPVNDFLTLEESRKQMEDYFYNAILMINLPDKIPDPEDNDLTETVIKYNLVSRKDVEKYKTMGRLTLYVLSRTFKHKKLVSDDDRRILSYTLDIISKLGVHDHRKRFGELANFIYDTIYN